jgi:hypothetical protein
MNATAYGHEFRVYREASRGSSCLQMIFWSVKWLDLPGIANEVIHNLCEHLMALRANPVVRRPLEAGRKEARVRLYTHHTRHVGVVTASAIIMALVMAISSAMAAASLRQQD